MTDPEYMDRAEAALAAIERGCDRINDETDADIDNQRVGGMITITFPNGSQLIVNLQKPLQEIWLAARSGGYHYRHDGRQWVDTKTGAEFFEQLSREASAQGGQALAFTA
ncbi:iron donor protein CyaY [Variovorax sp. OV329]|uniref:iron donor protein CyaY n=1 Tax=Variovorax sp. OV329 TaxID=1882825 RepID=UPI0008E5EC1F|nr:iron donor protein CyaY [Variovorax sp. OV329]SFM19075.1 CyaY protein [Variovorax sp. OV329]